MLIRHVPPERSIAGIVIAAISVIVMPLLARAKRRVARQIGSGAMHADSKQADFCSYLSAILLGGLLLNALLGWWWMDPAAGLVMVPIIGKEGIDGLRAEDLLRPLRASIVWSAFRQGMCSVGWSATLNAPRDDFADHWRALRNANTLLSSAPRNSGKRSWTNCTISRR